MQGRVVYPDSLYSMAHVYIHSIHIWSRTASHDYLLFDRGFNRFPSSLQLLWETVLPDIKSKELDIIVKG